MSKRICVVGTGYVGLIAAVGLADFGNTVVGVDIDEAKISALNAGTVPIYEPGVEEYLRRNLASGRLSFVSDVATAVSECDVVFIAVGTPPRENGDADLRFVGIVADSVAANLDSYKVIVTKSTVPVGTNRWIRDRIALASGKLPGQDFDVVSNPEFLREGKAISDFFHPDRTVIGFESEHAKEIMFDVYRALNVTSVPFVWCSLETAELIKYASNAYLAVKITFINEMANLAETVGADINAVARTMGMDGRIGPKFLHPGPGYGGSCFPKDTQALVSIGDSHGVDMSLVRAVITANERQKKRMVVKLERLLGCARPDKPLSLEGKTIAVLGLAFKQETDDVRASPALTIVETLLTKGATISAYDSKAMENFKALFPQIVYKKDVYEAALGADALIIVTEWNEFRSLDLPRLKVAMRGDVILDTRNLIDADEAVSLGFIYEGVGRIIPRRA
ncbi:MAG: UDP-glucose 6-dehydrogenase [Spirochaetes bacterium GWB1_59_5]|nr:MAG: UDP-glucose 6-dehydrogenase [Spirochaetes bacterium GWB1_59_5]